MDFECVIMPFSVDMGCKCCQVKLLEVMSLMGSIRSCKHVNEIAVGAALLLL